MLFGSSRVREVPNQLSRQLIYFGALEIVKFLTSETVNRRTDDGRYVDALTIEDISVHQKHSYFPVAFLAGFSPGSFDRICRIVSIMARIASGRVSGAFC
jgi:hypothetical protein